jgi:hypothetical protein
LFTQINGGNCISLMLNQGYGWAADVNLRFIFERIFSVESGAGYPAHRKQSQKQSRETLSSISQLAHRSFAEIVDLMPDNVLGPAIKYPGIWELLDVPTLTKTDLRESLLSRINK